MISRKSTPIWDGPGGGGGWGWVPDYRERRRRVSNEVATLCRFGLGLGHPRVTLGSRKDHPSVTQGPRLGRFEEVPLFAMKVEKGRVGVGAYPGSEEQNLTTDQHG
jgi:hypothetical protein